jgi:type II secretory ATPase GspE/PulE/Tfp pilus assembly ATPase PilB-like protein
MKAKWAEHQEFWSLMSAGMKYGLTLLSALEEAGKGLAGTSLAGVVPHLIADVNDGQALSQAMSRQKGVFSRAEKTLMRAGELGGVMDVVTGRIADGLKDGSFGVPETGVSVLSRASHTGMTDVSRFWRAFGWLISSGVPILEAFDIVREEATDERLREAIGTIAAAILEGSDMLTPLKKYPDLFPAQVCMATKIGEETSDLDKQAFRIAHAIEKDDLASLGPDPARLQEVKEADQPVIKCVNHVLLEAVKANASDIHFDPIEGGKGRVRLRVDGALRDMPIMSQDLYPALVSRIKIMSAMDIAEKRRPQDGRVMLNINGRRLDLRVSTVPTLFGERVVMRLLSQDVALIDLPRIGFTEEELKTVRGLCRLSHGMVLCSGPVGSGKTTLLYAMINELDREKCCVMSVEDPVEYELPGVAQIPINPATGLTFARALRSVLRQDPDVILVGEMRDMETVQLAMYCVISGHLLMTTTHANDAPSTIKRLIDIGIEPFLANSSVSAVIAQRLIRTLCQKCKQPVKPALHSLPPEAVDFIKRSEGGTFYGPKGCETCGGTGYRGRIGIHEILIPNDAFREAVAQSLAGKALRQSAVASGMKPMILCGLEKAARGITSVEEVCRVAPRGE